MTHSHLCNSDKSSKALALRSWAAWRLVGYGWNFARLVLGLISIFQKISIYGSWGRLFHRIKKTSFIYRSQIHQATFLNIFNKLTIVLLEICNVLTPLLAYILSWKLKNIENKRYLLSKFSCWRYHDSSEATLFRFLKWLLSLKLFFISIKTMKLTKENQFKFR